MWDAVDRRGWLSFASRGLAATALACLLSEETRPAVGAESKKGGSEEGASAPRTHFTPKATRIIQISLIGGLSHLDSFDFKPELVRHHGETPTLSEKPDLFFGQIGRLRKPDFEFRQRGQSGLWVSELFPHLASLADELCVLNSMTTETANHTPALYFQNSGFGFTGFPSIGSWLSFGLGTEADDLPAYVVLPDGRGLPNGGATIWSAGFVPAEHQGVVLSGGASPVRDLFPGSQTVRSADASVREFVRASDTELAARAFEPDVLTPRLRSYELAARMQLSIPGVTDLSPETAETQQRYGLDRPEAADCGRRCLLARRLLERGVRFVQVFSGGPIAGNPRSSWDAHENVAENHAAEAQRIDQPVAALLADLRQRGLLDDTLVMFTTEFGRTPFAQSGSDVVGPGRDHNKYAFSTWLAGAGVRGGTTVGQTDDIGWKVAEKPITWADFHATVLHRLGLDHERLTFYHNGIQRRLTNVHGHVVDV